MVELPYPPSVNKYWRHFRGRAILSKTARQFKSNVQAILYGRKPIAGRVMVCVFVHPPDMRRRDLDNTLKAVLDAGNGLLWADDSCIDELRIVRRHCTPGGKVEIHVESIEPAK